MRCAVAAATALAAVLASAACMGGSSDSGESSASPPGRGAREAQLVAVPALLGFGALDAQRALERRHLRWRWSEPACPENGFFATDLVYAQTGPVGALVRRGTTITLVPASTHAVTLGVPPCPESAALAQFDLG
jgi:hypothetical protein